MWKILLISLSMIMIEIEAAPQFLVNAPLLASPYTSAAYVGAPASLVAAPASVVAAPTSVVAAPAQVVAPAVSTVPAVPATAPATYPAVPISSVSAYSYGSSYSIQDYLPVVNPAPASLTYSLPYAYAADYFYRQ